MPGFHRKFLVHTVGVQQVSEWLGGDSRLKQEEWAKGKKKKRTPPPKLHFLKKLRWLRVLPSCEGKETSQQRQTAHWKTSYLNLDSVNVHNSRARVTEIYPG